jgi:hypothetical protein
MVCFTIQVILGSFPRGCVRSSELRREFRVKPYHRDGSTVKNRFVYDGRRLS